MTMPKYSLALMLLVISLVVVHANAYLFPHSVLLRHLVLWVYLLYGARQYYKFIHWDYKTHERRKISRDPRVPTEIYGRLAAEEAIKNSQGSLELLLTSTPANSPDFLHGYKQRIQEELDRARTN